jgi:hypothetical protein
LTRIPRVIRTLHEQAGNLGASALARVSAKSNRKTLVYLGAGLAIVGAGATASAGLVAASSGTASPADGADKVNEFASNAGSRHAAEPVSGRPAARKRGAQAETWHVIARVIAAHTDPRPGPGPLPAQDKLTPVGTSGPQAWLPITPARYANAATIVHQALAKKMGLRSAVIAVATAMQESMLLNINYGTYDSLGLFQQRPSMGWGTAAQILHPAYAADAFLNALRTYQANNPGWARQPLWQPAQGVQASGFPYAYAKWEAQAAQIVGSVARKLV